MINNLERIDDYSLLSHRVYEALKEAISKSALAAGEKVTETKLAKALGVSRTPVREALHILYSEGYVTLTPNASFVVNQFTETDAQEILVLRGAIEGEAARIAAKNISPEQAQRLKDTFGQINTVGSLINNETEAYRFYCADVAFHDIIMEIAANSHMMQISRNLRDKSYRLRTAISEMPDSVKICEGHHRQIMDAILDHQPELAYRYSYEHTQYISQFVVPQSLLSKQ